MTRSPAPLLLLATLAFVPAGGCARYDPKPLTPEAIEAALTLNSGDLEHLRPWGDHDAGGGRPDVRVDLADGLSPDEAAMIAVAVHPTLRAERNRVGVSSAQLLQAGILPNPQLSANVDPVVGGNTTDTVTGYGVGLSWEVTALIARDARVAAASAGAASVRLDVAWKEWQAAQAARLAVFDLAALEEQAALADEVFGRLDENAGVVR